MKTWDFETGGRRTYVVEVRHFTGDYGHPDWTEDVKVPAPVQRSTLISSEQHGTSKHLPALDIDHTVRVIPSSTEGHYHLYIDVPMSWWRYRQLLRALWKSGVIEKGYYRQSVARKATHLRLPWVKKSS